MKTVRLENSVVMEIIPEYALPVEKWYGEAFAALCTEAPDEVDCWWVLEDGEWKAPSIAQGGPETESSSYIQTPEQSAVVMMRATFKANLPDMDDDQIIQCSGLADDWVPGSYEIGAVYNANDQTWECFAAYDNTEHPDIKPSDPSWYTFNRPLHGKSPDTARPWVKPQHGTTDIYHVGECMVYTDGKIYRCKRDTNFSPDEYAPDWEVYDPKSGLWGEPINASRMANALKGIQPL